MGGRKCWGGGTQKRDVLIKPQLPPSPFSFVASSLRVRSHTHTHTHSPPFVTHTQTHDDSERNQSLHAPTSPPFSVNIKCATRAGVDTPAWVFGVDTQPDYSSISRWFFFGAECAVFPPRCPNPICSGGFLFFGGGHMVLYLICIMTLNKLLFIPQLISSASRLRRLPRRGVFLI